MEASAKQMAELEEQLVHERSRGSSLESKLERERERRETVQGELDTAKQVSIVGVGLFCGGLGVAKGRDRG